MSLTMKNLRKPVQLTNNNIMFFKGVPKNTRHGLVQVMNGMSLSNKTRESVLAAHNRYSNNGPSALNKARAALKQKQNNAAGKKKKGGNRR